MSKNNLIHLDTEITEQDNNFNFCIFWFPVAMETYGRIILC